MKAQKNSRADVGAQAEVIAKKYVFWLFLEKITHVQYKQEAIGTKLKFSSSKTQQILKKMINEKRQTRKTQRTEPPVYM